MSLKGSKWHVSKTRRDVSWHVGKTCRRHHWNHRAQTTWDVMSSRHVATCRGILVGLVNGSMLGGYDRLSASRLLRNKNINKCAINILRPYPPSIDLYYNMPMYTIRVNSNNRSRSAISIRMEGSIVASRVSLWDRFWFPMAAEIDGWFDIPPPLLLLLLTLGKLIVPDFDLLTINTAVTSSSLLPSPH